MLGAIIGDIAGNPYEWREFDRTAKIQLFCGGRITDDSVLTTAVCEALLATRDPTRLAKIADQSLKKYGNLYPDAGYGAMFASFIRGQSAAVPSFGNGAAMRVSPCGWAGRSLDEVRALADAVTLPSHCHKEALKGAEAIACAVFLGRISKSKAEICSYVQKHFYNLEISYDDYRWSATCMDTVPYALRCFLDSQSFEEAVTLAVRLGGDTDTMGAMAGSVAEAYYGIDLKLREQALKRLDERLQKTVLSFEERFGTKTA